MSELDKQLFGRTYLVYMGKMFYAGNDDRDFEHPEKYAFLNWRMDDGVGTNRLSPEIQMVYDNYNMGRGYLGNALLSLYIIEKEGNGSADIIAFPILFNIWHGVELWLKSACGAIEELFSEKIQKEKKKNHNIYEYYEILEGYIGKCFLKDKEKYIEKALSDVKELIKEFKRVDANFDFARYSFNSKNEYQFYNAPYGNEKQWQKNGKEQECDGFVPNTCLDLAETYDMVLRMFISFGKFVDCLSSLLHDREELYKSYIEGYFKEENNRKVRRDTNDKWEVLLDLIN